MQKVEEGSTLVGQSGQTLEQIVERGQEGQRHHRRDCGKQPGAVRRDRPGQHGGGATGRNDATECRPGGASDGRRPIDGRPIPGIEHDALAKYDVGTSAAAIPAPAIAAPAITRHRRRSVPLAWPLARREAGRDRPDGRPCVNPRLQPRSRLPEAGACQGRSRFRPRVEAILGRMPNGPRTLDAVVRKRPREYE